MNKNIQLCQIILIGLFISFVNTQQQSPKIQASILRHSTHCKKKVSTDSNIQFHYIARILDTNKEIENNIVDLKAGELTVVKGLNQGILGMCQGEIRRLTIPPSLHVAYDGQISNKAIIYDVEVLKIQNPELITPFFWVTLSCISAAYFIFHIFAENTRNRHLL